MDEATHEELLRLIGREVEKVAHSSQRTANSVGWLLASP